LGQEKKRSGVWLRNEDWAEEKKMDYQKHYSRFPREDFYGNKKKKGGKKEIKSFCKERDGTGREK